jgi:hypothetical protein
MAESSEPPLSSNQKAMLDLALGCHLKMAPPGEHDAIRARHKTIKTRKEAAQYISEVETKVHSRRKIKHLKAPVLLAAKTAVLPKAQKPPDVKNPAGAILVLVALMVGAGLLPNGWNFALVTIAMAAILLVLGLAITNRPFGVLINERNLMSLSRFQMAAWTIVVLAGYFTFAMARIRAGVTDALAIGIDPTLWGLLGISTTSLVGTPMLLNTKKDKTPAASTVQKTAALTDELPQDVAGNRQGTLYANSTIKDARLTDMFEGDEIGNTAHIDLPKVQMFYFTVIGVVAYFVATWRAVAMGDAVAPNAQLPAVPPGLVALLGISHAGYLTSKGVSHTKTQE